MQQFWISLARSIPGALLCLCSFFAATEQAKTEKPNFIEFSQTVKMVAHTIEDNY